MTIMSHHRTEENFRTHRVVVMVVLSELKAGPDIGRTGQPNP